MIYVLFPVLHFTVLHALPSLESQTAACPCKMAPFRYNKTRHSLPINDRRRYRLMRRMTYDKLVRDRIPELIEEDGKTCEVSILSPTEYLRKH